SFRAQMYALRLWCSTSGGLFLHLESNGISAFRLPFAFSNIFPQLQSTVRVHLNEVDSISHLRSLRHNDSFRNDFFLIEREHQLNFCADLHREHRFDVAATETNLVSCRSHLRLTGTPYFN